MAVYSLRNKPVRVDLEKLVPGDHWSVAFYLMDSNEAGVNIRDYEASFIARDKTNGKKYLDLSVGNGITMSESDGKFSILATPTDTGEVDVSRLVYDFRLKDDSGIYTTYATGNIPVHQNV